MLYRPLGKTKRSLPAIGQGTTQTGGYQHADVEKDRMRCEILRSGVELGMNFIDTAELYGGGHAEEIVGKAIKGMRDRVFIASKFNPEHSSYCEVKRAAEGSLKRLQIECLDLYQMHWPNPFVPLEETLRAIQDLVREGKVKYFGLSNCALNEIKAVRARSSEFEIVSIQMEYSLLERSIENDILPFCIEEGLTVLAYSPLCRGALFQDARIERCLGRVACKYNKTVSQVALRWLLSKPGIIALVKSASLDHTRENAKAADFTLGTDDIVAIDAVFERHLQDVVPARIRPDCVAGGRAYRSVEEAVENRWELIPSPMLIARNIERGHFVKPVPVVPTRDLSGVFDYDLVDNQILYWAWVIAKGMMAPIPTCVRSYPKLDPLCRHG